MELYLKVGLAVSEGMTRRQAAKHFNISRDSVSKMVSYSTPPGYQRQLPIRRPKLDAFVSTIEHWLEEDLKGKKFDQKETVHIVVLRGTSNASATLGRTKGFAEIAKTHPNWEILDSDDADFTTAKGREVMEKYLQKYKDIDVVVSQNDDMTFGAIEAIRAAGKTTGTGGDITLISFDGTRSALEKVKSGVINVDIECNPLQGTYIQEIINRLEDGESVDKINYVEEKVYTQKNVLSVLGDRVY